MSHKTAIFFNGFAYMFCRDTTVRQRHCRFVTESNLTHFKIYSRGLCMQECRLNLVYRLCGCIPHFYPNQSCLFNSISTFAFCSNNFSHPFICSYYTKAGMSLHGIEKMCSAPQRCAYRIAR